jgi:putative ABC transport system substrate-binding protein
MRRREFITLFGGAAVWPLAARAQQPATPVIGFLHSASPGASTHFVAAFRQGLNDSGYVENWNIAIEYRWADNERGRLSAQAADLVHREVAVIVTGGGLSAALAAKAATELIPIVFTGGFDPVRLGLVASYNRPGGNVTGFTNITAELETKRLGLLDELVPGTTAIGFLVNPNSASFNPQIEVVQAAARTLGKHILVLWAGSERDLDEAFASLIKQKANALIVSAEPFFTSKREQLVALAMRHAVPMMSFSREFAEAGGLISYGARIADAYRQAGVYAGRILRGTKPTDLPVQQPTKFELVINLKTAKALGLMVPRIMLVLADEVIE